MNAGDLLVKKFFEENSLVRSDIESFNNFVDRELQKIVDENKIIEPTIIPPNVESFKIQLNKIWVTQPEITEADGSKRIILPTEARLRNLSYSAPIYIEISSHINDVQRETFTTQIGSLPIMLKSKYCHLSKMSREELVKNGEDPDEPGGYFIINGTERVLVKIEDLAPNHVIVENSKDVPTARIFSESGSYRIPHQIEKLKDGVFYLSFTRLKRVPIISVIKALGMVKDEEIMKFVCGDQHYDELIVNLFEFASIKNDDDAIDFVAKKVGIVQSKEIRMERMNEIIDKFLLPHVGMSKEHRIAKAQNLCKILGRLIAVSRGESKFDDKDHYMNKRVKMSGDLLAELVRLNLKVLIGDLLYNFQRIVKRGKFPSIKLIIRDKLLTSRIYSAMATGNWVGGRTGVSQRIQRLNYLNVMSHLQRVVSPLSSSQENFAARALHPTHWGRLCPSETPEGTNIGLRKNLAMMATVSGDCNEQDLIKLFGERGLKTV